MTIPSDFSNPTLFLSTFSVVIAIINDINETTNGSVDANAQLPASPIRLHKNRFPTFGPEFLLSNLWLYLRNNSC